MDDDRIQLINNEESLEEAASFINDSPAYTIDLHNRSEVLSENVRFVLSRFNNLNVKRVWLTSALIALLATVSVILFPNYIQAANQHTDCYCALLFCSLVSTLLVAVVVFGIKLWDRTLILRPPVSLRWLISMGTLYGCCGLIIFYARDRNRVLCHLQDPLSALILPSAVTFHLFFHNVDKVNQLICIAAAIIGLFISVDFQIWDEFSCHGDIIMTSLDDGQGWPSSVHLTWTFFYVISHALLAYFYVTLDKKIKLLISEENYTPIQLENVSGNSGHDLDQPSTSRLRGATNLFSKLKSKGQKRNFNEPYFGSVLVFLFWVQLVSTVTILFLFWTDFFAIIGKAGSSSNFNRFMRNGFSCYFGVGEQCSSVAALSWMFIICYTLLFGALIYFMAIAKCCSANYSVGVLVLCLPLSTICWSFIQTNGKWQWAPVFTGETGFTVVGLPIMMASLILFKYYADSHNTQII